MSNVVSERTFKKRDFSGLGFIDYALMSVGTALAVWSAGMAIGQESIALFSSSLVIAGTAISFLVRTLSRGRNWTAADSVLYPAAGISAAVFSTFLQSIMPEGGFPKDLFAAGWLSWMLILGSFVTWRDATLLFQAVPAIALFGLVGCYDTYRSVVILFFLFLVCLTTFFARAHGRQMLREAVLSGYFALGLAPGTPPPTPDITPGLIDKLRDRPWRWVAGPGWALGSALIIVFLSLLGAPVIQNSMQGVAGFVRVNAPRIQPPPSTLPPALANALQSVTVASGPILVSERPALTIQMDRPRFMRGATYDQYTGHGWSRMIQPITQTEPENGPNAISKAVDLISQQNYRRFEWELKPLQLLRSIPLPGEPLELQNALGGFSTRPDGVIQFSNTNAISFAGVSAEYDPGATIRDAVQEPDVLLGSVRSTERIPASVADLARQAAAGKSTDYEKARAIEQAIADRVRYSLNAPACPEGLDPVEHTLFTSHVGYCDVYATSMVLMARSVGIPARYATGFIVRENSQLGDHSYVVEERDAHAWAELLFQDVGWVIFDPTELAVPLEGEEVGGASDTRPWYRKPLAEKLLNGGILLVFLAAVGWSWRSYAHARAHPNYDGEWENQYLAFAKLLSKVSGSRRMPGMSATEYLRSAVPKLGAAAPLGEEISKEFEAGFYSNIPPDGSSIQRMRGKIADLKATLKGRARGV